MKTILVSGNDTGIGKTWTVGSLGRILCEQGYTVQIVKPVETGISDGKESDASTALKRCSSDRASSYVLRTFAEPIAPACAAAMEGQPFCFDKIVAESMDLPEVDFRIVEGAGSLAVPFDNSGRDWADFANAIAADFVILVVEDRLGAIGQARMVHFYGVAKGLKVGLWLNQLVECDERVRQSTLDTLNGLGLPIWGRQAFGVDEVANLKSFWMD
tara:strand:- start:289 stop:933 length:645 start_codon:yes stop_codon:yes gene_type:complete